MKSSHAPDGKESVRLSWLSTYHGPSTTADDPVVLGELRSSTALTGSEVLTACHRLYALCPLSPRHGRIEATTDDVPSDDGLLLLGRYASNWALAALNEVRGFLHEAGAKRTESGVVVWLGFHDAALSRHALELALRWLTYLLKEPDSSRSPEQDLDQLWLACRRLHPDWQTRILMVGARALDVPVLRFLEGSKYWQFGWGARSRVFMESSSNADGLLGSQWQRNKLLAKRVVRSLGFPTAEHTVVSEEKELEAALSLVGFPCVIKPVDGGRGRGVTASIMDVVAARDAFHYARAHSGDTVMIERHLPGWDHRLLVIGGHLIAAIRREAASIEGDGESTVAGLIAKVNETRSRDLVGSNYLQPIDIDATLEKHLLAQGAALADVVPPGCRLTLRSNANLSTGGTCTDVTEKAHKGIRAMAEQLAATVGLHTAGLDYITPDIGLPPGPGNGAFIEMNTTPGLRTCVAAGWGEEDIARIALGAVPATIEVRLRIVAPSALASRRSELEKKLIAANEGWVCAGAGRVGPVPLFAGGEEPWQLARTALRNQRLEHLEIVCTGKAITRFGLPVAAPSSVEIEDPAVNDDWRALIQRLTGQPQRGQRGM